MKKYFLLLPLFLVIACEKIVKPTEGKDGDVYIVNNGSWGDNNAEITVYDIEEKISGPAMFASVNGKKCGDLAQDILHEDGFLYISVNGSQIIYKTDENLKIVSEIVYEHEGKRLSPRYLCEGDDCIYVTYYEGYLGRIDKKDKVSITPVGSYPEGLAYLDGKIYVANSGGMNYPDYDNTVSIVDARTFKESEKITVNCNPSLVRECDGKIYVSSLGNYTTLPPALQCIDTKTKKVSQLDYSDVSSFDCDDDKLYILCGGYDDYYNPLPGTVYVHDCEKEVKMGPLSSDGTTIPNAYSISCAADMIWVGSSDYKTSGDVYVFDLRGKLYDKFNSGGLNPIRVTE